LGLPVAEEWLDSMPSLNEFEYLIPAVAHQTLRDLKMYSRRLETASAHKEIDNILFGRDASMKVMFRSICDCRKSCGPSGSRRGLRMSANFVGGWDADRLAPGRIESRWKCLPARWAPIAVAAQQDGELIKLTVNTVGHRILPERMTMIF
jgi:hypothetical protein